jgi:thioredoxin-dependent peroxiredoxin|tara:strand:- start:166 stop:300 length:135 start_codon:yes stop_codon:yes gene_type:complete
MLLNIGDKAPDFSLENQDKTIVSIKDLKGEKFILWFYPKASTPG